MIKIGSATTRRLGFGRQVGEGNGFGRRSEEGVWGGAQALTSNIVGVYYLC